MDTSALPAPLPKAITFKNKLAGAVHSAWDYIADFPYRLVVPTTVVFSGAVALQLSQLVDDINPENPGMWAALATGALATGIYAAKSMMVDPRPPRPAAKPKDDCPCADP